MPRKNRHISEYETEIIRMHSQGMTLREIAEKLGFTHKQVQEFKTRYNRKNECLKPEKQYIRKADRVKAITEYHHQYKDLTSLHK